MLDNYLNYSILRDHKFTNLSQQLEAKAKELRVQGYGKQKNASHPLSEADKEFLWSLGHLGKHSAQALVNANFKNATENLSLHGN